MSLRARIVAYDKEVAAAAAARSTSAPASIAIPDDVPHIHTDVHNGVPLRTASPPPDSPQSCTSSNEPLSPDSSSPVDAPPATTQPTSADEIKCRANEHLAVLIPRELWKPDRLASHCDKYACRVKFTLFERKHHCRKCGGVFCHQCSARTTTLLDTKNLPFLLPPKGTPITAHASPSSPVINARVCDDCFEQLHGYPTPRPRTPPSSPVALAHSFSSLSTLPPATPPDLRPAVPVRAHSYSSFYAQHLPRPVKTTKLEGDLDRYPLKDPSETCKAAGGGRWSPTPIPRRWDARLPDGRIRYEVDAERRAEAKRRRAANPVIVDGPIRVRRPQRQKRIGPPPPPTF